MLFPPNSAQASLHKAHQCATVKSLRHWSLSRFLAGRRSSQRPNCSYMCGCSPSPPPQSCIILHPPCSLEAHHVIQVVFASLVPLLRAITMSSVPAFSSLTDVACPDVPADVVCPDMPDPMRTAVCMFVYVRRTLWYALVSDCAPAQPLSGVWYLSTIVVLFHLPQVSWSSHFALFRLDLSCHNSHPE